MTTTKITRSVSTLCATDNHRYCPGVAEHCECSCHFEEVANMDLFRSFAYDLWRISPSFKLMAESERRSHFLSMIRSAEAKLDFQGFSVEDFYERIQPTLSRDYWSLRETYEDFGLDFLDRYQKS